jgi:formate dehydrogenase gamma subunit
MTEPATRRRATAEGPPLVRFDGVERVVHLANASLFTILILTGAALYYAPLMELVGRRELIERIHVYAGIALPVPVVLALIGPRGRALRTDLRRLNRWTPTDRAWLRASSERRARRVRIRSKLRNGKFNAGQKLNAAFTAGAGLVMLGTGLILRWYRPWPLSWREGATFVHNWLALIFVVVIAGHILYALSDNDALRSIIGGRISRSWARRHAPAWLAEIETDERRAADTAPTADPRPDPVTAGPAAAIATEVTTPRR